jgi:hypothetical protein
MFFEEPHFQRRFAAGLLILSGVFVSAGMQRARLEAFLTR